MTNIWKRSLSMFMAIVMVFGMMPLNAFATTVECEHANTSETTVPATCTENGSVTVSCTDCNTVISTEEIAAAGHTPGEAATCVTAQTCTVCGAELAAATGVHTFAEDATQEKCNVCEAVNPNYIVPEQDPEPEQEPAPEQDPAPEQEPAPVNEPEVTYVAEVDGVKYTDIQEAIKAAAPSGTVTLLTDVTVDEWIMFAEELNISSGDIITLNIDGLTIDGHGHELNIEDIESAGNGGYLFYGATNLNVKDLTIKVATGLTGGISLKSGKVENVNFIGGWYGVLASSGTGTVTVEGCAFDGMTKHAIYTDENSAKVVAQKNVFNTANGGYAMVVRGASEFTDNTVTEYGKVNVATDATGVISGNNFGTERFKVYNGATATISGNTINNLVFNDTTEAKATFTNNDLSESAQNALDAVAPAPAPKAVAKVGETPYETLTDALAAAQAGATITFVADITEDVTVSKAVTIDGAGKTYTGEMKLTNKADITIKNVNFDGKGYNGYAVNSNGAYNITIMDCTAKNYGYGFVQVANGAVLITVKNVTVSGVNYGVKVDYSNAVVLENVDITAGVAAVLNSNYGSKTITIKNSKLNILGTWTRNNTTKTNYVFEGANTIDSFITEAAIDNFKLAAGATLTAPEDITVTTVEDYEVKYENGTYTSVAELKGVAMIGETPYESVAAALAAARADGLSDVTITLVGAPTQADAVAKEDSFNLCYETAFNSVTFKQEDASKVYYIDSIYTGSRVNGGNFVFDGVNIVVTGQYMFEGNVVLCNNASVSSIAEANCFIYNGTTTIEPGSKLKGVIDDLRAGDLIVDGGKTDGTYNTEPDVQDAIMIVNWSGDKLILKNGAYVKINSANEVGRLTVNEGAAVELTASKLDACQYITLNAGSQLLIDGKSQITTPKITGTGTIKIDATGMAAGEFTAINADLSGFTGTVAVTGNSYIDAEIKDGKIVLISKIKTGTWGGIDWTLDETDGTLTIAPTKGTPVADKNSGKTYEVGAWREAVRYNSKGEGVAVEGWPYDRSKVTKLVIEEGVTSIGSFTAQGFTNLTGEVVIPSTVTYIGQEAFQKSTFTKLTFAAGGTEELCIAQGAFKNLVIEEVALPADRPVHLHAWVFNNCHNLKTVYLPATLVSVHGTNHIDYFKDFNAHSNPTWTQSSEIFAYDENLETITFGSEVVRDMFYAKNNGTGKDYTVANVGLTTYCDLEAAIEAAKNGETVKLIKDVTLNDTLTIPAGYKVTLDLNGKTISQTKACTESYEMIANNGTLTITGNGKISFKDTGAGDPAAKWGSYTIRNSGTLVVENGTIEHLGEQNKAGQAFAHTALAIFQYSGSTTINGGTISTPNYRSIRLWSGDVTINGGTFDGQVWVQCVNDSAKLTINGGSFSPNWNDGSSVFVNNSGKKAELAVTGGTFETKIGADNAAALNGPITGGTFTEAAKNGTNAALLNKNAKFQQNADGTYGVVVCVAKIGEQGYETLADAISAAEKGATITFMADINENVTINKNLTIDGGNFKYTGTMTANKGLTVTVQNVNFVNGGFDKPKAQKSDTGVYTFKDCSFVDDGKYPYALRFYGANTVTVEDCTVSNYLYSFLYIVSGTGKVSVKNVTVENCPNYAVYFASGVNTATFENLTVKDANNGFIINNSVNRAFTIKNVKMENVGTAISESKGTNTITCTVLGENNFGTAESSKYAKYILAETTATLTAPNDITVTTDVENMKVDYKNGAYQLVKAAIAKIGTVEYATLQEAVDAANAGATIKLICDAEGPGVVIDKKLIINFNGKTYAITEGVGSAGTKTNGFQILKGANVTLQSGTLKVADEAASKIAILVQNYGDLKVYNATMDGTNLDKSSTVSYTLSLNSGYVQLVGSSKIIANDRNLDGDYAIDLYDYSSAGYELPFLAVKTVVKVEGKINALAKVSTTEYAANLQQAINNVSAGGTVTLLRDDEGPGVVINKKLTMDFGGHTYTLTEGVGSTGTESNGFQILKGNTVTLRNGTLKVADSAADKFYILIQNYANLTVNNMTLDGTNLDKWSKTDGDSYTLSNNSGNVTIGANTKIIANNDGALAFAFDACDKSAWGYELPVVTVNTKASIQGNVEAAAKIGNVYYATLQQAINAAKNGGTITLVNAIDLANETTVLLDGSYNTYFKVEGKSITIDLNGKKISGNYAGDKMLVGVFSTENGGHLTLTGNGTVDVTATGSVYALLANYEAGCSITVENGTYTLDKAGDSLIYSGADAGENEGVTVKGGTFTLGNVGTGSNGKPWIFNCLGSNVRNVIVSGGTYNSNVNAQYWAHEVDIVDANGNLSYVVDNKNGTWTVTGKTAEAAIMTDVAGSIDYPIGYATLADALAAAKAGQAVLLMKDIEVEKSVAITGNRNVVIDLNGHTMSSAKAHVVTCYYSKTTITIKDSVGGGKVLTTGSGKHAFVIQSNLVIDGAEISSNKGGNAIVAQTNNANVTIQNDAVINGKLVVKAGKLTITGGTFENKLEISDGVTVAISAGYFKYPVKAEWCAEGCVPTEKLENGYYSVVNDPSIGMTAKIGDDYYETLADAIAAAKDGDTITLLADIALADQTPVLLDNAYNTYFKVEGKSITIDLNGKNISGKYTDTTKMLVGVFSTDNGGHLTLTGEGTVDVTTGEGATVYSLIVNYEDGCSITVKNGTYTLDKAGDSLIYSGSDEDITVEGGTFTLNNVGTGKNGMPWIFNAKGQNTANIIVNGGSFNDDIVHQYWIFEVQMPEDLALSKDENGIYTVVPAVAYVTEREWASKWYDNYVGYATLEEAIEHCDGPKTRSGQTSKQEVIVLLKDIVLEEAPEFHENVVLDKNGCTITIGNNQVVTGGDDLREIAESTNGGNSVVITKPEIEINENITVAENKELLINSTSEINFQGNGKTITTNGTGTAAGESYDYGYVGFIPAKGEDATVENVTVTGSGFVEVGHHGTSTGGNYTIDKLNVKNLVATLAVKNGNNNIAAAFSHYGNAVMTNCVMTGTTTEKEGFKPYDAAFVNGTTTELNACEFDYVYVANQAKVTVGAGTTIDVLDSYAISTKGLGKVVICKDARIGTINLYDTGSYKATLLIEEGARVGVINYNDVAYSMEEWMARK